MTRVLFDRVDEPSSERQLLAQIWAVLHGERATVNARQRAPHFEVLLGYRRSPPVRCLRLRSNVWTHLYTMSILRSGRDDDLGFGWIEKRRSWAH